MQAAGRHAGEAGPSVRRSRRDRETVASSGTTGSDSTTGIHWGIGGWREACSFFFTWRTTVFFLSFISSCILLSRSSSREENRKVVHAFRAIAPPQSVLMWYSCCSCLKLKEGADDRLHSLDCSNIFSPRGPRCSVPLLNLRVISVPPADEKCCRWEPVWSQSGLVPWLTVLTYLWSEKFDFRLSGLLPITGLPLHSVWSFSLRYKNRMY